MNRDPLIDGGALVATSGLTAWISGLWHRRTRREAGDAQVQLSALQELAKIREEMRKEIEGYRREIKENQKQIAALEDEVNEWKHKHDDLKKDYDALAARVDRISRRQEDRIKATAKTKKK